MPAQDVNILDHDTVFTGYFRIDRYRLQHSLYDGGMSTPLTRDVVERGQVAAVLPYDPIRHVLVLIEQFRAGALSADWHPWIVECVAGVIERGETAHEVAVRETREEAGCVITELVPMHRFLSTPGVSSECVDLFCGRVDANGIAGIYGVEHEGEDIKASVIKYQDAMDMLAGGAIRNAITLIAMQWLALNIDDVRARWA